MSNKAVSNTFTGAPVRASVSVVAPAASANLQQLASAVQYVIPSADLDYVSIVVGVVLDPIGRNPFVYDYGVSTDYTVFSIGKVILDLASTGDAKTVVFGKRLADTAVSSETKAFAVSKTTSDSGVSSDSAAKGFAKAPIADLVGKSDSTVLTAGKNLADAKYVVEGPRTAQDYVDVTYFAQDYALDGGPVINFSKVLSELLDATDDFYGEANIDDDQVMLFAKTLADSGVSSETVAKGFARSLADSATKSDAASLSVGKTFADVLAKSDIVVRGVGKQSSDTASTSDSSSRNFNKALSDTPLTGDSKSFSFAKVVTDSASSTDSAVRSFSRATTDSITNDDRARISVGKAVIDTASKSDSGTLRMTDYVDITYFSQDYMGTSVTF